VSFSCLEKRYYKVSPLHYPVLSVGMTLRPEEGGFFFKHLVCSFRGFFLKRKIFNLWHRVLGPGRHFSETAFVVETTDGHNPFFTNLQASWFRRNPPPGQGSITTATGDDRYVLTDIAVSRRIGERRYGSRNQNPRALQLP
jgi:hypothetical protein